MVRQSMRTLGAATTALVVAAVPALAQGVTLADLQGRVVESRVFRVQTIKRDGKEYSSKIKSEVRIHFAAEGVVHGVQTFTWLSSGRSIVLSDTANIGKTKSTALTGGGHFVAIFEGSTLTYARTLKTGAFKATFQFFRSSNGLSCRSTEHYLRETGADRISMNSVFDGQPIVVVKDTQLTSACHVGGK